MSGSRLRCGDVLVGTVIACDLEKGHDGEHFQLVFGRSEYRWLSGETFKDSEARHGSSSRPVSSGEGKA